jgi:hypothetical protein
MSRISILPTSLILSLAIATVGAWAPTIAHGQTAVSEVTATTKGKTGVGPTARQRAWLNATPEERVLMAERLGEQGAAALAEKKGYRPILTGEQKAVRQGFDQVYQASDGRVVVVEAKGGSSPICRGYGAEQGTPEWAVKAARETLRNSRASAAEQRAAQTVLEAADRGNLTVEVIRTRHTLGEPVVAVQESTATVSVAERELAKDILRGGESLTRPVSEGAGAAMEGTEVVAKGAAAGSKLSTAAKAVGVVGAAVDAGFRGYEAYQVEQQYREGKVSQADRVTSHAGNAGGFVGGWSGAWAGAETGAAVGGAAGAGCGGVGAPVGAAVGGAIGGVGGYLGGEYVGKTAAEKTARSLH